MLQLPPEYLLAPAVVFFWEYRSEAHEETKDAPGGEYHMFLGHQAFFANPAVTKTSEDNQAQIVTTRIGKETRLKSTTAVGSINSKPYKTGIERRINSKA